MWGVVHWGEARFPPISTGAGGTGGGRAGSEGKKGVLSRKPGSDLDLVGYGSVLAPSSPRVGYVVFFQDLDFGQNPKTKKSGSRHGWLQMASGPIPSCRSTPGNIGRNYTRGPGDPRKNRYEGLEEDLASFGPAGHVRNWVPDVASMQRLRQ